MKRALSVLATAATAIACVALVGMALVEAWQVFARYVLNDSPGWTEPVALLLMNTTMMFGAAAGVRAERHFGFFIVAHSVPAPVRRVLTAIAQLIAAATGGLLATWGARLFFDGLSVPMAGAALPQGMTFLPICLGGALIAVFAIERLVSSPETARVES